MSNFKNIPPKARFNIIIANLIVVVLVGVIICVARVILLNLSFAAAIKFWVNIVTCIIMSLLILDFILEPTVGYHRHRYRINEQSIEKITGICSINHEIVPIRRMLQVEISEGPINRIFSLASIEVTTAGGTLKLEYIERDEAYGIAEKLKDLINDFVAENGKIYGK